MAPDDWQPALIVDAHGLFKRSDAEPYRHIVNRVVRVKPYVSQVAFRFHQVVGCDCPASDYREVHPDDVQFDEGTINVCCHEALTD